jgi:hypothetical protein
LWLDRNKLQSTGIHVFWPNHRSNLKKKCNVTTMGTTAVAAIAFISRAFVFNPGYHNCKKCARRPTKNPTPSQRPCWGDGHAGAKRTVFSNVNLNKK